MRCEGALTGYVTRWPLLGREKLHYDKSTAAIFTHVPQPLLGADTADKLINGTLLGFDIGARGARFSELFTFLDSSRLDGVETLVDIKGFGIGETVSE